MSSVKPALLTIRDAAERLHVTPRTLKYYEERGLVTPNRSEGRYRLYSEHDLEKFSRILRLRSLDFFAPRHRRNAQAADGNTR